MYSWKILRTLALTLFLSLFTLSNPTSLNGYLPLPSPLGGVSIGLAQGNPEETVTFVGEAAEQSSVVPEGTEVLEKRTLTSKTYQVGPDEYKAIISVLPMHYLDEEGRWQDIDTRIQRQADGNYYSGANSVKAHFPAQLGAGGFEIVIPSFQPAGPSSARIEPILPEGSTAATGFEDISVTWQPIKLAYSLGGDLAAQEVSAASVANVAATVSDNAVVYEGAYPGVAEAFMVVPGGVKHSLVLSSLPGFISENPPPDAFLDYQVEMSLLPGISLYADGVEQREDFSTSSTLELRRGEKEVVGYLLAPYAYERDNPRQQIACTFSVHFESDRVIVTVRTPLSWLAAPDRTYPVVIDPTTHAALWQDTFISSTHPTSSFGHWVEAYAGYDLSFGYGLEKTLMYWNVDPIPASSNITNASIRLFQFSSQGNPSCGLVFYRMLSPWNASYATWNNRGFNTPWSLPGAGDVGIDYDGIGYVFGFSDTNNIWKVSSSAGFAGWVQGWINGTYPNRGVLLKPPGAPPTYDCERGFRTMNYTVGDYAPYLEVVYTFTGGVPTLLLDNAAQTHTYPNPENYYREDSASHTIYWRGTALRPLNQSDYDLWLHTAADFSQWQVSSQYGVGRVDYTLTKELVGTTGYPRVVNFGGTDDYNIQYMHRLAQLDPPTSGVGTLPSNVVWIVLELYLSQPGTWQVVVTPLSGDLDLGVAIHDPTTGDYHTRNSALALSDQAGQGLTERFEFTGASAGFYGLVVWSNISTGATQQFQLEVKAPSQKTYLPIVLKNYVPPQGPFSNGGFENSTRWTLSGQLEHERTTEKKRSGSYSVRLGHDGLGPCLGGVPCSGSGENCESAGIATQGFDVPNSGSPSLSFYYQIYTYDHKPGGDRAADHFAAYIRDLSTSTDTLVYNDDLSWVSSFNCDHPVNTNGSWQPVSSIDLSPYKGKTVELIFKVTNGGHNFWNTWVYVDDVTCSGC